MIFLTGNDDFPDVSQADSSGLLAVGGELTTDQLIKAYSSGIFPWFNKDEPILWWSPDPRYVLFPDRLKISKSMRKFMKSHPYIITYNTAFPKVIESCSSVRREGQSGSWITEKMINAYLKLFDLGYIKSVEVWEEDELVGGLYGVDLGNGIFCGESMFSLKSNTSKLAFIEFIKSSDYRLIDCQVYTDHLKSLGAEPISRLEFMSYLNDKNHKGIS